MIRALDSFDRLRAFGVLARHHADPFDRMLIAQARVEKMSIITADVSSRKFDVEILAAAV